MLIVKLLALEIGALLIYAGVKGLSVQALLKGDNTTPTDNRSLSASSSASSGSASSGAGSSAPATPLFGGSHGAPL